MPPPLVYNTYDTNADSVIDAYVRALLSATAPLSYDNGTGIFSISQSGVASDGYLSSADWSTFNSKQNALTFGNFTESTSSVLTITGGTGAIIGAGLSVQVKQASGSQSGYLSSTDWTTFNNKQDALGNFTTGQVLFGQGTSIPLTSSNLFWDNTNRRLGINVTPLYKLDINGVNAPSQFHISGGGLDSGAYITTFSASTVMLHGGAAWNGITMVAKATSATSFGSFTGGIFSFFSDTGLTAGNSFTSTERVRFSSNGGVSIGNSFVSTNPGAGNVILSGVIGIGVSAPTANVHVKAGTASANTAPLKIDSGTNLTSPEAGTLEYNGSWFMTIATGPTRYQVPLIPGTDYQTPLSLPLSAANGGTGISSYAVGDIIYASASATLSKLADVATGNALISGGVTTAPSWGKIGLTTHITGTLAIGNGGTNLTTYAQGDIVYASAANTLASLAKNTTATRYLSNTGSSNNPAWSQVDLTNGVTGTLPVGSGGTGLSTLTAANRLIYSSSASAFTTLTSTASRVLVTDASGVPNWNNQLPDHLGIGTAADTIGSLKNLNAVWIGGGDGSFIGTGSAFGFSLYTGIVLGQGNGGALLGCGRAGSLTLHPFTGFTGYDWGSLDATTKTGRSLYFGGGVWDAPDANFVEFWTAPTYTETHDTAVLRGKLHSGGNWNFGDSSGTTTPGATVEITGNCSIGQTVGTTATAKLHLGAGTASANTAPLKIASGTNLTTAEAGAFEYNGTNLFFTRTGTTRENVLVGNSGAAAPSTTAAGTVTNRYGGATNFLGDPNSWASVVIGGTTYKIPLYT